MQAALDRAVATVAQVAVLDVNLRGKAIFPAAETLRNRGIPIVFSTGYGQAGIEAQWKDCPVVQKPFALGQLQAALAQLMHK